MRKLTLSMAASVLATAAIALAAPAVAQTARPDMTRAEVEAKAAERFAKIDANNDGVLNAADREARRAQAFARLDTDKNGSISEAEFNARQAARAAKRPEHAAHQGMTGGKRAGLRGGGRGKMGKAGMLRRADTNGDNAISRAEFTAAALARFTRADADNNGTVTQAERQAARDAMRAQRQSTRPAN